MLLEFDDPLEVLPINVRPGIINSLREKSTRIFPEVNDLLLEVGSFLTLNNVDFAVDQTCDKPYQSILATFGAKQIKLYLVIDYQKFNIKTLEKNFVERLHKSNNCRTLWVKLFEWEDLRKRVVLKSLILHALGLTTKKIAARKTYAEVVSSVALKDFFNKSSFYGFRSSTFAACLKDKQTDEILMAMSFGNPYYGKNKYPEGTIECIRAATIPFTAVQGGMTKLMKFIIKSFDPVSILYYVDDAHYDSKSMNQLGFKYSHFSSGATHNIWIKSGRMFMRAPSAHHEVMYLMKTKEIVAVPDVGNSTYIWSRLSDGAVGNT